MADSQRSLYVFPFFDLPLEMREMVYDEAFEEREGRMKCGGLNYTASSMPILELLLVSKQFEHEYRTRSKKKQSAWLKDNFDVIDCNAFTLPHPAARLSVTVDISIQPGNWDNEIHHHHSRLQELFTQLPHHPSRRLIIKVARDELVDSQKQLEVFVCKLHASTQVSLATRICGAQQDWESISGPENDSISLLMWPPSSQKLEPVAGPVSASDED